MAFTIAQSQSLRAHVELQLIFHFFRFRRHVSAKTRRGDWHFTAVVGGTFRLVACAT
jgi:hypothetical protein